MVALEPHQFEALRKIHRLDGKAGVFIDRGGGKTRVALVYCSLRKARRILVVCPFSVPSVWEQEVAKIGADYEVFDLTAYPSVAIKAQKLKAFARDGVVLINYESYWRKPLIDEILRWKPDAVIFDEAHRIRHRGPKLSKAAFSFASKGVPTRLALTGTPISNGLQDVWSIFRFVNPTIFGNYADFEGRFIIKGGFRGYEIKGYRNEDIAERLIGENSFQWEDDLPAPPDVPVFVTLSPRTRKVYDELKKFAIAKLQEAATDHTVTAPLVITQILRLQQVTSGFIKDVDNTEVTISSEKTDATVDLIEDAVADRRRVVVFTRFIHDLDEVARALTRKETIRFGRIDGAASGPQRRVAMEGLRTGKLDVLLVQEGAGSEGIDLSAASIGIFYSTDYSVTKFLQAKGRLTGALRQKHPVTFYHILARGTIDERVYAVLSGKMDVANRFTDLSYSLRFLDVDKSNSPVVG